MNAEELDTIRFISLELIARIHDNIGEQLNEKFAIELIKELGVIRNIVRKYEDEVKDD